MLFGDIFPQMGVSERMASRRFPPGAGFDSGGKNQYPNSRVSELMVDIIDSSMFLCEIINGPAVTRGPSRSVEVTSGKRWFTKSAEFKVDFHPCNLVMAG